MECQVCCVSLDAMTVGERQFHYDSHFGSGEQCISWCIPSNAEQSLQAQMRSRLICRWTITESLRNRSLDMR